MDPIKQYIDVGPCNGRSWMPPGLSVFTESMNPLEKQGGGIDDSEVVPARVNIALTRIIQTPTRPDLLGQ